MTKSRCFSLVHSFILAAMVAMFFSCGISSIITCVLIGIDGLQNYSTISNGIQFIQNSEYFQLLLTDLLSNKPFSIIFTAVFSTASIYMLEHHFRSFLRSSQSSMYCAILYFLLLLFYFIFNRILPISKFTIFFVTLGIILIFSYRHNTENDPLWTGMDEPPKYRNCSMVSLTILVISTLLYNGLIMAIAHLVTKFLTYIINMLIFPYIIGFIIIRFVNLIEITFIITGWQMLGKIHDYIIVEL